MAVSSLNSSKWRCQSSCEGLTSSQILTHSDKVKDELCVLSKLTEPADCFSSANGLHMQHDAQEKKSSEEQQGKKGNPFWTMKK